VDVHSESVHESRGDVNLGGKKEHAPGNPGAGRRVLAEE